MANSNPDKKQSKYWQKRNEQLFLDGEKQGLDIAKRLKTNYEQSLKRLTSEIYIFYNEYAKEGKLDLQEAKKLLNKDQLRSFRKELNEFLDYAKKSNFSKAEKQKIKLMQLKTRISRLEELKSKINFELAKLTNENEEILDNYFKDTYEDAYYRTIFNTEKDIGFAISYTDLNTNLIEKAVGKNYNLNQYSYGYKDAIWQSKDVLTNILEQAIPQGLTLGYNPKKLAAITSKKLDTGYNNTVRLMRTEYNYLLNQSTADGYLACGIDRYQLLATLDNRTSEICQEMDGQVFYLKDKEVGINYPPFHPNCRTTTIPYFEPDEIDAEFGIGTRLAKDKNGQYYQVPANMTYKQWKDGKVDYN